MITINRKILRFQKSGVSISMLTDFYQSAENRSVIVLIYENGRLLTLLSYEDLLRISGESQLSFYLEKSNNCQIWDASESDALENAFSRFPLYNYLILSLTEDSGMFACRNVISDQYTLIFDLLREKGVHTYRLNLPDRNDIPNDHGDKCKINFSAYIRGVELGDLKPPLYIDKISNVPPERLKAPGPLSGRVIGKSNRTLYLIGPCIVQGWENPEGERLADLLYQKLTDTGYDYQIECLSFLNDSLRGKNTEILEHTIRRNDIVILLNRSLLQYEIDITPAFHSYDGEKWLYQEMPIHTTAAGNDLIADIILKKIIRPIHDASDPSQDDAVLFTGTPQFTPECEQEIEAYINRIRRMRKLPEDSDIGAIVMNCNPFTLGHRYLVEYAAAQVDYLYVFVVEEDLSAIPFSDRLFMIYEGLKDLSHVIIVPSGQFIISKDTFSNYFEKETEIHHVSAEEDVTIFARYIARGLHISKRFVGSEPTDHVTNVYNQTMKRIFPQYGLTLIEIPRKELDSGRIISASTVRKLLLQDEWEQMKEFVPETTLHYLKRIKVSVAHRIEAQAHTDYTRSQIHDFILTIRRLEKVILYTIGHDTRNLLKLLPEETKEKIVYCDKSARHQELFFHGKKVIPPDLLVTPQYRDYSIVVTSVRYGAQIYEEFTQMGIDPDRCIFNLFFF